MRFIAALLAGFLIAVVVLTFGNSLLYSAKQWFNTSWCTPCTTDTTERIYAPRQDTSEEPEYSVDPSFESDVRWLALNMYYHRGERNTDMGRKAVTAVVLNRLTERDHYFGPRSIRGIITFGYEPGKCTCNFSWYCDGKDDVPDDPRRFEHDRRLAAKWLSQFHAGTFKDPTYGATWFIYKRAPYPQNWPDLEWTSEHGEYAFYRYPYSR